MKLLKPLFESIRRKWALLVSDIRKLLEKTRVNRKQNKASSNYSTEPPNTPKPDHPGFETSTTSPSAKDEEWQKKQERFWERQICCAKVLNWITIFGTVAAFGGLYILHGTLQVSERAADAAKEAADAAAASTAPWIVADIAEYRGVVSNEAVFYVVLKNVGRLPALEASAGWEITVVPMDELPTYKAWACPKAGPSPAIVPVEKPWKIYISKPLNTLQMKMLASRTGRIFLHGCATYRDVLTTRDRITELAFFYPLGMWEDQSMSIDPRHTRMK
ncbi:MAG TPA: hypothetical protein VGL70_23605 [Candidatus Binatia bacterium]|jgi:hypothetical protein